MGRDRDTEASTIAALGPGLSNEEFRRRLPVYAHRQDILYVLEAHQVVILVGQTGSGKTTQIPQYLHEAGWTGFPAGDKEGGPLMIACTQPRRVAAISVASRVAEEINCELGSTVGYSVRFDEKCSPQTRIRYMTDGMLFRETLFDPLLSRYSVVMIDEAHERTIYTDLLLALLKKIIKQRAELKIIVSSATMDALQVFAYFGGTEGGAKILKVQGRVFPVDVFYLQDNVMDIPEEAASTVIKINEKFETREGDILAFLPGREEIEQCARILQDACPMRNLIILPLHAALSLDEQIKVFSPPPRGFRRVILATNIAEASVTIEGIVFVLDSGLVKQKVYDPTSGLESLVTTSISKASAQQRAGRAGRTRPGMAFRLYTEEHFEAMSEQSIPEIQKCNMAPIVLQLKALGIDNISNFDFMSPPTPSTLARAYEFLYSMGAISRNGHLTGEVGVRMAELPVDPMLARMLIASSEFNCANEAATIVAMICAQPVFVNVGGGQRRALDESKRKLGVGEGDLLTLLNIHRQYLANNKSAKWCSRHHLSPRALQKASHIRTLLLRYMERFGLLRINYRLHESSAADLVKCIVRGLFANAALAQPDGSYRSIRDGLILHIHPASVLFKRVPSCVVFYEMLQTAKCYMRDVTVVEMEWLSDLAPEYYELSTRRQGPCT